MSERLPPFTMPHPTHSRRRGPWPAVPGLAFAYLHLFRRIVVGLAFIGAAVGWVLGIPWLFAAGVTIGIGEWLESSYYIGVLRWGQRRLPSPESGRAPA